MSARSIFIGGTSSNAGKSWVVTAICASLARRGRRVAPFKAQNMSNNSFPCRDGGEIGRAQVAQAHASGLEPETAMNPILLKPNGDGTSQVVVRGRVWKTLTARQYYEHADVLRKEVLSAYQELAERFEVVVIEGAGSVSELNLRPHDLVNLGLVTRLGAPWVLVADIERGGVFASVIGTISLLTAEERTLCRGFLINKFRGDLSLFESGAKLLESRAGVPCLGVFPHADDLRLDAEDSLALSTHLTQQMRAASSWPRLAIVRFPCLSNATDFKLLTWADWIDVPPAGDYEFIVLPGSKQTLSDLSWLRAGGLDRWVLDQHGRGATVIGVCGGFQMLGEELHDPLGVESSQRIARGLGLLPVATVMESTKTIRVRRAHTPTGAIFEAYEIHVGKTACREPLPPFAFTEEGLPEGVRGDRAIGTYLHGCFESAAVCAEVFGISGLGSLGAAEGVEPAHGRSVEYQRLADWFETYCRAPDSWLP